MALVVVLRLIHRMYLFFMVSIHAAATAAQLIVLSLSLSRLSSLRCRPAAHTRRYHAFVGHLVSCPMTTVFTESLLSQERERDARKVDERACTG